jgi:hypothetical protein
VLHYHTFSRVRSVRMISLDYQFTPLKMKYECFYGFAAFSECEASGHWALK